jgi:hypothetical protein
MDLLPNCRAPSDDRSYPTRTRQPPIIAVRARKLCGVLPDAPERSRGEDRSMQRIVVTLDAVSAPRGQLEQTGGPAHAFDGWLQLIAALEDCLEAMRDDEAPGTPALEADP